MNFVALIGVVGGIKKGKVNTLVDLKVEKPFVKTPDEEWFEQIPVALNNKVFKEEIEKMKVGNVIGIKGSLTQNMLVQVNQKGQYEDLDERAEKALKEEEEKKLSVRSERVQVF